MVQHTRYVPYLRARLLSRMAIKGEVRGKRVKETLFINIGLICRSVIYTCISFVHICGVPAGTGAIASLFTRNNISFQVTSRNDISFQITSLFKRNNISFQITARKNISFQTYVYILFHTGVGRSPCMYVYIFCGSTHLEARALSRTVIEEGMRCGGGRLGGRSGYTWPDLTLVAFLKRQLATQSSTQNTHRADFRDFVVRTRIHSLTHTHTHTPTLYSETASILTASYGVASVSRIDQIIGLFCKRTL